MLSSDTWETFNCYAFDRLQTKSASQVGSYQSNWAAQHSDPGVVAHSSFTIRATTVMTSENSGGNPAPTQVPRGKKRPPAFSIFAVLAIQTFALILKA
jgi:hypothetical protein